MYRIVLALGILLVGVAVLGSSLGEFIDMNATGGFVEVRVFPPGRALTELPS